MFLDRKDGAIQLANLLTSFRKMDGIVVGVPKGGVITGCQIAKILDWPFSYIFSKKIKHPTEPYQTIGSVGLHKTFLRPVREIPYDEIDRKTNRINRSLQKSALLYSKSLKQKALKDKTVIITDDGMATGCSMEVTIKEVRREQPAHIIVAIPVASSASISEIQSLTDEVFVVHKPSHFVTVKHFYAHFPALSDSDVVAELERQRAVEQNTIDPI
ncbi:MAG: phosphoribosyltransferase family protein [Bacteroidota bacterium]